MVNCEVSDLDHGTKTRKLMESFYQFRKLKWKPEAVGLKHSEMAVLFCIHHRVQPGAQGMRVSELSTVLQVTAPSVTQLLNNLEINGYVERNADPQDRRSVRVRLTAKGASVTQKVNEVMGAKFAGLLQYLGEDDTNELIRLLAKVFIYFDSIEKQQEI